ncbi:hypothetical protein Tco_1382875 [Tanacetum coccineum]
MVIAWTPAIHALDDGSMLYGILGHATGTPSWGTISYILIMYGLRAMLEKKKEFSDINGHLFQVVLFIFGSVGTLAVSAFSQGVKSKLAKNIGTMKMFMLLLGSRAPDLIYSMHLRASLLLLQ